MCSVEDAEGCQFYREITRKARKEHKCYECRRIIPIGEKYSYETAMWDGQVETMKVCLHCVGARGWLSKQCGGYIFGNVLDELKDHIDEYQGVPKEKLPFDMAKLARLVIMMKRQWKRFKSDNLYPVPEFA